MAKNDDEIQTADYKTTAGGKKVRAHRIVFNKGEEDNTKLREESMTDDQKAERERIVKGMKKNYKGFVAKYGKDRAKSVMYATATKTAMKEEAEQLDELSNDTIKSAIKKHAAKATDHASKAADALDRHAETDHDSDYEEHEHHSDMEQHHMNKIAKLKSKLKESHPFDIPKSASGMSSSTRTMHDVKKTSTGTVYTKQRDADGNSKEFKRDPDQAKRGRGRPKKNSFGEAAEFLMSLTEEQFEQVTSEGFDIFFKSFENINK